MAKTQGTCRVGGRRVDEIKNGLLVKKIHEQPPIDNIQQTPPIKISKEDGSIMSKFFNMISRKKVK